MAHVFISFVEENAKLAEWIVNQLRSNGLDPWFSKDPGRIIPGDQWKQTLRQAIQDGGFYVPLFTKEWSERNRTVANEELTVAIEEARLRGLHRRWFVPVKIDATRLPDPNLGGGLSLSALHYVDFPQLGWERGLRSLMQALGVEDPIVAAGEPLAPGFGSTAEITGGSVTYRNFKPPIAELDGTSFSVTNGWVRRNEDGVIFAKFRLKAPFEGLEQLNAQLGLQDIDVLAEDPVISVDPNNPTRFSYADEKDTRPPGSPFWEMGTKVHPRSTVAIDQDTGYEAFGYLNAHDRLLGSFKGYIESSSVAGRVRVTFDGDFEVVLRSLVAPPV